MWVIFGFINDRDITSIYSVEVRGAVHPALGQTVLHKEKLFSLRAQWYTLEKHGSMKYFTIYFKKFCSICVFYANVLLIICKKMYSHVKDLNFPHINQQSFNVNTRKGSLKR